MRRSDRKRAKYVAVCPSCNWKWGYPMTLRSARLSATEHDRWNHRGVSVAWVAQWRRER